MSSVSDVENVCVKWKCL